MLEVNDFNAVRIALASPEQIRSWSYGEVLKPETINYRTLKPEKDGLFCEKIFGPTKDFECYCGKYKRVRYKGIICDKCGVEVARSKVRRERMGHIELASPVSHIWFVKGTPSRLGLLLDISPRSLERVLYFAQHIITYVDEAAKERAVERLNEELERESLEREKPYVESITEIELARDEGIAKLEAERDEALLALEEDFPKQVDAIMKQASDLEAYMSGRTGKSATKDVKLGEHKIVSKGEAIKAEALESLKALAGERVAELENEAAEKRADVQLKAEAAVEEKQMAAAAETEPLRKKMQEERESVAGSHRERMVDLEDMKDPITHDRITLVTDAKYRELQEKVGDVFTAGMGAEAVYTMLQRLDLDKLAERMQTETQSSSGQRRKKAVKRLRVVEALRKSGNKPEWMVFTVLPVLPPDLRPMVQLDGGRFATSDLNDLYRRVINRNNRLKRLLDLGAPEIIIRNEKRMLQEAVDSLIDNGRRGRAVSGQGNHKLKSLSDMLKGKQGRFRQNLLGKRVDYSGRSVIVVGPNLKLHQCGLPKRMALELFKPFIMHSLVAKGMAHNIKSAKRIVERGRPEVWDVLDEVIEGRPVLLNRAPTLHRLGIQAFEPVLVEGSAIQIHPLVCAAFNADFDGDQMAVHVPLSREAVAEARQVMLSTHNLLLPSSGEPTVAPTLDIVLGCFYMTMIKPGSRGEYHDGIPLQSVYGSFEEAKLAYELKLIDLQARIKVRDPRTEGQFVETNVGRVIFDEVLPPELPFHNEVMDRKGLKSLVAECHQALGSEGTAEVVDRIKHVGFTFCTRSGVTIAINDIKTPVEKARLLEEADARIAEIDDQYAMGLITEQERYDQSVRIWTETTDKVQDAIQNSLDRYGSVYLMASSGAKGNITQIRQMAGMRGLMSDPSGRIIDLPIRSSFREGLSVLEYFISTHGARKGLADTALRTADSGYLTRRLIDVAQDVIVLEEDCGAESGVWLSEPSDKGVLESLRHKILGRWAASDIADSQTGEIILERDHEIDEDAAERIEAAGIARVHVRSPLTCQARRGICRLCYGRNLAHGDVVQLNEAVGIVAAQSIGEPGTQLTMRTFHTGGVAGLDITSGLPRVEELFEARVPKAHAIISEIDGVAEVAQDGESRWVKVTSSEFYSDHYELPKGAKLLVENGDWVDQGAVLARVEVKEKKKTTKAAKAAKAGEEVKEAEKVEETAVVPEVVARIAGQVNIEKGRRFSLVYEEKEEREYPVAAMARILVDNGESVHAGQKLTDGSLNPQDVLRIIGPEAVQRYLVEEVQKVYRSQGVNINDKHIEVIIRQMLRKVRVDTPGDTGFLPGELVDRFRYEEANAKVLAEGGEPATAVPILLGVTKASLSTESFLAAASFQETTRVLTEASISGMTDRLLGLKENVIIGKLIPARATVELPPEPVRQFFLPGLERPEGMLPELAVAMGDEDEQGETRELQIEALMAEPFQTGIAAPVAEDETPRSPDIPQTYFAEPDEPEENVDESEAEPEPGPEPEAEDKEQEQE
ncbi:MAG TPA: DNA-directed RNA polymerase subunit beta' [Dehalococcoidia bacterium]|nr:DNA-directed RNA polymerase subunit beta' [Dehalococcoidia bacterium]